MRIASLVLLVVSAAACHYRDQEPQPPPVFVPPPPDRAPALEAEIARLQLELVARESRIQEVSLGEANLTRQIEEMSQVHDEMSERLRLSSQSLEQLAAELEATRAKLGEHGKTNHGDAESPRDISIPSSAEAEEDSEPSEEMISELVSEE